MSETKRKLFTGEFKAKVALEAIRGVRTVNEIGQEFGVHPTQVGLCGDGEIGGKNDAERSQASRG